MHKVHNLNKMITFMCMYYKHETMNVQFQNKSMCPKIMNDCKGVQTSKIQVFCLSLLNSVCYSSRFLNCTNNNIARI